MTWSLVQNSAAPSTITSAGAVTPTLPAPSTAGNLLIFKVMTGGSTAAPTSVTSGFTDRLNAIEATAPACRVDIYDFINNTGGISSATATLGNGGSGILEEWTWSTGPPGASVTPDATGTLATTTPASPFNIATSGATTAAHEMAASTFIYRFSASTSTTMTAGTGFTASGSANNGTAAVTHYLFDYEADTGASLATVTDGVTVGTVGAGSMVGAIVTYAGPAGGSVASSYPAAPGRTWWRQFKHRQMSIPQPRCPYRIYTGVTGSGSGFTVPVSTQPGDAIVITCNAGGTTGAACTDSQGNIYVVVSNDTVQDTVMLVSTYGSGGSGTPTAALTGGVDTLTPTGSSIGGNAIVCGVPGVAPYAADASPAYKNGNSTAALGNATGTLSQAGDIIISAVLGTWALSSGGVSAWGDSLTQFAAVSSTGNGNAMAYKTAASTASDTPSATMASSEIWIVHTVALVPLGYASVKAAVIAATAHFPAPSITATTAGINQPAYNRWRLPVIGQVFGIQHQGSFSSISAAVTPSALPATAHFPAPNTTATTAGINQPAGNRWRLPIIGRVFGVQHQGYLTATAAPTALAATAHFPAPSITATTAGINQPAYNRWRLPQVGRVLGMQHHGYVAATATPSALAATAHFPAPIIKATTAGINQPAYNRWRLPIIGRVLGIQHQGVIFTTASNITPGVVPGQVHFPSPGIQAVILGINQPAYNRWRLPIIGRVFGVQHTGTLSATATPSVLAATAHFPAPSITATTAVQHQPAYNRWRLPLIGRVLGIQHHGYVAAAVTPSALAATAHFPAPVVQATTAVQHQPAYNRWRLPIIGRVLGIQHHGYVAAAVTPSALATNAHFPSSTIKATTAVQHQPAYNRWRLPLIGRVLGIQHHGSVSLTSTVTPAVLSCSTVIPAVAPGVAVPGLVPVLALAAHFPAPLVIANDILSVSVLAASTTLPTPTVDNNVVLGPPALAAHVTLPMPTVNAGEVALAVALGATSYFPVPAISTSSVSTATALGATAHLPAPSVPVGPVTTHGASSLPAPFVTTNSIVTAVPIHGTVTITGTPSMPAISLAATAHFGVPVINEGTAPAATALGATSYFPVPTVITTTVWASALHAATTLPAPSGAVTVPAVAEAGTTTFPAPTVNEGQGTVPAALGALSHFPAPAIAVTVPVTVLAATAHLPAPATAAGEVPAPAAIAAAAHLPTPVVLVSASPGALHGAVTFPLPAVRADMKLSPPVLAATTKFPAALLIAHWTVTATAEFAFNVGQGEPDMTRTAGDAPWISSIDASSALSETPWISSEDGTIRMAETPTIWIQGDGS